jgi:hypothetical protein
MGFTLCNSVLPELVEGPFDKLRENGAGWQLVSSVRQCAGHNLARVIA